MPAYLAILFAIVQGVTELFPVSSLGHAVVLPVLLGLPIDLSAHDFLPFLVVLHVGTAIALLLYFWREWIDIAAAVFRLGDPAKRAANLRLLWLIVIGTIPAVILGAALRKPIGVLFSTPIAAASFLIVNGVILFAAERLRQRTGMGTGAGFETLNWKKAMAIGLWQSLALLPGLSRSGTTMVGGLLAGLQYRESARFSFLLATPIIFGAAVHEVPTLIHEKAIGNGFSPVALVSCLAAGITAYLSTAFLMRYFGKHEFEALNPFAYYCVLFGAGSLAVLYFVF